MCLNPKRLLCVRGMYKGVIKTCILFNTTSYEYQNGFASRGVGFLNRKTLELCSKIGVVRNGEVVFDARIELPCRKCLECTRNRSKEWAVRCQLESLNYPSDSNFFVTLTYRDSCLPKARCLVYNKEDDSYVKISKPTLCIQDCQKFMKALRKPFERSGHTGIRFFSCGEYGSKTRRPHYHFILFNLPLDDLVFFKNSDTGFPIYRSKTLEQAWPYGFVTVQRFTFETARYVAQYCVKKLAKSEILSGLKPEFINMSRRPGIGMSWFYKNMEDKMRLIDGIPNDHLFLPNRNKDGTISSLKFKIPSAFTRIFKPVTDSKRGIDTEIPDIAYMLNVDNEMFIDALSELKAVHDANMEDFLNQDLAKFGFLPEDKYNDRYFDYLELKEMSVMSKFYPRRKEL